MWIKASLVVCLAIFMVTNAQNDNTTEANTGTATMETSPVVTTGTSVETTKGTGTSGPTTTEPPTTSSGMTTVSTAPPTPTPGEVGMWQVNNTDKGWCIKLEMGSSFNVSYYTKNGTQASALLHLPAGAAAAGNCSFGGSQIITLAFADNLALEMSFAQSSSDFQTNSIKFSYDVSDAKKFPDTNETTSKMESAELTRPQFKAPQGNAYTCMHSNGVVTLGSMVSMSPFNLTVQAFHTGAGAFGSAEWCAAEAPPPNNIVPIVVGAALAGLVVIVLIAYLIGRRRNKRGYESV